MAYTSVIPVRRLDRAVKYVMNKEKTTAVSLQDALDYAANRDKTEQSCFESSYACTLETAFADMRQTKERWHISTANLPSLTAGLSAIEKGQTASQRSSRSRRKSFG